MTEDRHSRLPEGPAGGAGAGAGAGAPGAGAGAGAPASAEGSLIALAAEHERARNWTEFVEVCRRLGQAGPSPERIKLLQKAGMACEQRLHDLDLALAVWNEVLVLEPKNRYAVAALKRLQVARGAWDEVEALSRQAGGLRDCLRLFEQARPGLEPAGQAELSVRIGRLHREIGGAASRERAMAAFEQARALDPARADAPRALAEIYSPEREPRELCQVLEALAPRVTEPGERARVLRQLADVRARLGDAAGALAARREALEIGPADDSDLVAAEELARATGAWEELSASYRARIARLEGGLGDGQDRAELVATLVRLACIREEQGDGGEAAVLLERVVALAEPAHAVELLDRPEVGSARWRPLYTALSRAAERASGPEAVRLLYRAAAIAREPLDDVRGQAAAYQAVVDRDESELRAVAALVQLHAARGAWPVIDELLTRTRRWVHGDAPSDPAGRAAFVELALALAQICGQLSGQGDALDWYARVLQHQPERAEALAALEALLSSPDEQLRAAQILERAAEATGVDDRLAPAYEVLAEDASGSRRAQLLFRAAALRRAEGQTDRAFELLAGAAREAPGSGNAVAAFDALEDIAGERGSWSDMAEVYRAAARQPLAPGEQVAIRLRLARIYAEKLGDRERAVRTYQQVVDLSPGGAGREELARLLAQGDGASGGATPAAAAGGDVDVDDDEETGVVPDTLVEKAMMAARTGDAENPGASGAEPTGAPGAEPTGSDDEITDVHDDVVTGVSDEAVTDVVVAPLPVVLAPSTQRVVPAGSVAPPIALPPTAPRSPEPAPPAASTQRSDEDDAFESLMGVLLNNPELDRVLLQSFEALAERTGRWHDLTATCEDLAARLEEGDAAAASHVWLRVAQVHERRLGDTASALIAAEQAGRLAPSMPEPLARRAELHRLRGEVVERAAVLAELAKLLEIRRDWQALLETYEQVLELAAGEEQRFAIVRAIAELVSSGRATPSPDRA